MGKEKLDPGKDGNGFFISSNKKQQEIVVLSEKIESREKNKRREKM